MAPFRLLFWYSSNGNGKNHLNLQYVYPATKPKFDPGKSRWHSIIMTLPLSSELTDFLDTENYRDLVIPFLKTDVLYQLNAIILPVA